MRALGVDGDAQTCQPIPAFDGDPEGGEEVGPFEHRVGAVREDLAPTGRIGDAGTRRGHQAEVPPGVVDAEPEFVAPVVDVVLDVLRPRAHEHRRRGRLVGGDPVPFAGGVAGDAEVEEAAAPTATDADAEAFVGLLVDHRMLVGAEPVAVDPPGALGLVLDGVEDRRGVGGPAGAGDVGDLEWERCARGEILQPQGVLAEAGVVGAVQEETVVIAHAGHADRHVLVPLGELVHVEEDRLFAFERTSLPAVDGVLLPLLGAGVVPVRPVLVGHRKVGLLDAREHLIVEQPAEFLDRGHHLVGVGVLRLEVGAHRRILLVAEPGVRIGPALAVERMGVGALGCDRGSWRGGHTAHHEGTKGAKSHGITTMWAH